MKLLLCFYGWCLILELLNHPSVAQGTSPPWHLCWGGLESPPWRTALWMASLQPWQGLEEPLEATQALGALVLHKALSVLLAGVVLLSAHLAVWAGAWLSLCEDHSLSAGLFQPGVV